MPTKFKETSKDHKTGKVQNFYIKSTPIAELEKALASNATPKMKQKIRNELARRV